MTHDECEAMCEELIQDQKSSNFIMNFRSYDCRFCHQWFMIHVVLFQCGVIGHHV